MYLDTYLGSDTYTTYVKATSVERSRLAPSAESNVVPGSLKIMAPHPLEYKPTRGCGPIIFFYHGLVLDWVGPEMACSPHTDHH